MASRECWNSPRNIRNPSLPSSSTTCRAHRATRVAPLHSISWHPTPLSPTLSTHAHRSLSLHPPPAPSTAPLAPTERAIVRFRAQRVDVDVHADSPACERSRAGSGAERWPRRRGEVRLPGGVDRAGGGDDPEVGVRLARAARRRRRPASERRRSSLRALHDRHDATTLSHACGPPRDRGTTWSMFSAARLQYWQRWPSRANTARRESGTRLRYGTRTKWTSRITDGHRHRARARSAGLGAVARDDLGLLLQHEHDGPAHRHDAERLEAGVEQQRSSQASRPPHVDCGSARSLPVVRALYRRRRPASAAPSSRHHSR